MVAVASPGLLVRSQPGIVVVAAMAGLVVMKPCASRYDGRNLLPHVMSNSDLSSFAAAYRRVHGQL